jgi:hypothetical protein
MFREDQDEHSAGFETFHDSSGPSGSRFDITRGDPTFDFSGLEMGTNRRRGRPILLEWLMKTIDGMLPPRYQDFIPFRRR